MSGRTTCACGCAQPVSPGRRYVHGHNSRGSAVDYVAEDRGHTSPCWIWQLSLDTSGYGHLCRGGRKMSAHRWYYERHVGPIPAGAELDHLCRVRACCNPGHLEPVTSAENTRRAPRTRLTERDARMIRRALQQGETQVAIAARFGISQPHVSRIKLEESWVLA